MTKYLNTMSTIKIRMTKVFAAAGQTNRRRRIRQCASSRSGFGFGVSDFVGYLGISSLRIRGNVILPKSQNKFPGWRTKAMPLVRNWMSASPLVAKLRFC